MYRRIEILNKHDIKVDHYEPEMNELGLIAPKRKLGKCKFYFTEDGWKAVGRKLLNIIIGENFQIKVYKIKESRLDIDYKDDYQVAGKLKPIKH